MMGTSAYAYPWMTPLHAFGSYFISVGQSSGIGKAIFLRGKNHGFEIFGEGN